MKQIYTKTGDGGHTSLRGGTRVAKDDPRIEANGQIDHLNSILGVARAAMTAPDSLLPEVQRELMTVMSHIATPQGEQNPRTLRAQELTHRMEAEVDSLTAAHATGFVVPGDSLPEAFLQLARTQARNVERRLWHLQRTYPLPPHVLMFFNRLSDYLFALAVKERADEE